MPRTFPTHTELGRRMAMLGYTATDFSAVTGIHPRTLTEYVAGRKPMTDQHLMAAAEALDCHPDVLAADQF